MKKRFLFLFLIGVSFSCSFRENEPDKISIRGWSVLTDRPEYISKAISHTQEYEINHLQLSHDIIMDLRQVKNAEKQQEVNSLIKEAHSAGIDEVTVWDHALYPLNYYPDEYKTGPGGTIDLDNPEFWSWLKQDYRNMLALIPGVDGLILTFIETGARAEQQYSQTLESEAEKLAKVVNNIADVVIGELGKKLYIRTFAYSDEEYAVTVGCIDHLKYDDIVLMMKETAHDFFLTHPSDKFAGTINRPTIIEFDAGNEFNGQGVIANTWPQYIISRWKDFLMRDNIIGYVARTDRYGTTSVFDRPSEILIYTLYRFSNEPDVTDDMIYEEFISREYGADALPWLKPAFESAFEIVTSSLYTLGTNTANHSALDYDPYPSSYARHVSGKWLDPPVVFVEHGVNKEFHYWKDIIQHIAPARFKTYGGQLEDEAPYVLEKEWVTQEEKMNEEYLRYILAEKSYGVEKARNALAQVEKAKPYLNDHKYNDLFHTFYRTLITARLHEAVAKAYFGYRIYARGDAFVTESLKETIRQGLAGIQQIAGEMDEYTEPYPIGQWNWKKDRKKAVDYFQKISVNGWPDYNNVVFDCTLSD